MINIYISYNANFHVIEKKSTNRHLAMINLNQLLQTEKKYFSMDSNSFKTRNE